MPRVPTWMKKVPDTLQSKRITQHLIWSFNWLALMDSHGAGLIDYFGSMGLSTIAIHGGKISHASSLVSQLSFFDGELDFLLLFLGGNDLADFKTSVTDIAHELGKFLTEFASRSPHTTIVTGSAIPRVPDKRRMEESADHFIGRVGDLDKQTFQVSPLHHHFCSDLLIGNRWTYGTVPRLDLYGGDLTHLNDEGRQALFVLFDFVFESVNFGQYDTRREFSVAGNYDFRTLFWAF